MNEDNTKTEVGENKAQKKIEGIHDGQSNNKMDKEKATETSVPKKDNVHEKNKDINNGVPVKKRTWMNFIVLIFIAFLLVLCVFFTWQFWMESGRQKKALAELVEKIEQRQTDTIKHKEVNKAIQSSQKQLVRQVQVLETQQVQQHNINEKMQLQLLQAASEFSSTQVYNPKKWQMAEALYLIQLAQQRIVLEQDAVGAINILQAADQILLEVSDVGLLVVRKQLKKDISALMSLNPIDSNGIILRLDDLNEKVQAFESIVQKEPSSEKQSPEKSITEKLSGLISIKKLDSHHKINIDENLFIVAQQRLQLNIEQAKLSLMNKNQLMYQRSINSSMQVLALFFSDQYFFEYINEQLNELKNIKINNSLPQVMDSINRLKQYIYQPETIGVTNNKETHEQNVDADLIDNN